MIARDVRGSGDGIEDAKVGLWNELEYLLALGRGCTWQQRRCSHDCQAARRYRTQSLHHEDILSFRRKPEIAWTWRCASRDRQQARIARDGSWLLYMTECSPQAA